MKRKRLLKFSFILVCGLWTVDYGLTNADTIHTKDNQELKGIVVEDYNDRLTFSTADGEISVMKSNIKDLYFDMEEDNMIKLAEQARDKGDYQKAYSYYQMAAKLNPDSKQVKDGLVFLQGYLFRKDEVRKEEAVKRQEELERYGPMISPEKSQEEEFKDGVEKLKRSLGLSLAQKGNLPEAEGVSKNSPAYNAGIRKGDLVAAVWSKLTGYLSLKDVIDMLLEKSSIEIKCTIERTAEVARRRGDIGASFSMEFDGLTVANVKDPSPALDAGLKKKDLIVAIDGQSTRYMPLRKALELIKKSRSETVKLTLRRELTIWRVP